MKLHILFLFLCDDNVKFMTGTMLSVDGGWVAS